MKVPGICNTEWHSLELTGKYMGTVMTHYRVNNVYG